jgi:hypothetical protein
MERALTLVIGGRRDEAGDPAPPAPVSPAERDARALVDGWLDAPYVGVQESLEDLVHRIARAFAERDPASAGH